MKRRRIILWVLNVAPVLAVIGLLMAYSISCDLRDWIKFRVHYRDYLAWRERGGQFRDSFQEPLVLDRHRENMVRGLAYDQSRQKFPSFTDGNRIHPRPAMAMYLSRRAPGCWLFTADGKTKHYAARQIGRPA